MDMFLQVDGIPGEAMAKGHEHWIPLLSVDWGVSQPIPAHHGGGGGAGKTEFRPATFVTLTSAATPLLFEACASGRHIADARFEALRAGDRPTVFVRWEFEDILVTSLEMSGSNGATTMMDTFALSYRRIRVTTYEQDPKGGPGTATARGWDLAANRPW